MSPVSSVVVAQISLSLSFYNFAVVAQALFCYFGESGLTDGNNLGRRITTAIFVPGQAVPYQVPNQCKGRFREFGSVKYRIQNCCLCHRSIPFFQSISFRFSYRKFDAGPGCLEGVRVRGTPGTGIKTL